MTAIVGGNSLGLSNSSAAALGAGGRLGNAATGNSGEQTYVNAATGNLVIQRRDEFLAGVGPNAGIVRTYNSEGLLNDDNADNWRIGFSRKVYNLTGTINTSGSAITRIDEDGAEIVYSYDSPTGTYVSDAGAGARDCLTYDTTATKWTWRDGDSQATEQYASHTAGGLLLNVADRDGNLLSLTYTGSLVTGILTSDGERIDIIYDSTAGKTANIIEVRSQSKASSTDLATSITTTRVRYGYDSANRLQTVTVDLTPNDNVVTDGKTYVTTYTYDGVSKRIAGIAQSDGSSVQFTYDASFRIATVKDVRSASDIRTTTLDYSVAGQTTITDALGQAAILAYDAGKQLIKISQPLVGDTSFTYDAKGNVTQVTDANGHNTAYRYDSQDNRIYERDPVGNVVERRYGGGNQLLEQTVYVSPDPDAAGSALATTPQTTRFTYDAKGHLRFQISPEGRVTEYRYDAQGRLVSQTEYTDAQYDASIDYSGLPIPALATPDIPDGTTSTGSGGTTSTGSGGTAASTSTPTLTIPVEASTGGYITQTGGTVTVTSKYSATSTDYTAFGDTQPVGTTFRAEIMTDSVSTSSRYFAIGAENARLGNSARNMRAFFIGDSLIASYLNADGTPGGTVLGLAVKTDTTYVIEVVTSTTGATLYAYEKGKTRADAYSFTQTVDGWDQARWQMSTHVNPYVSCPSTMTVKNLTPDIQVVSGVQQGLTIPIDASNIGYISQTSGVVTVKQLTSPTPIYATAIGDLQPLGATFSAEVTTDSSTVRFFYIGAQNTGTGPFTRNMLAYFSGYSVVASYINADGTVGTTTLGDIKPNTTYVTEVVTSTTGATLYVYEKGKTRAGGFSYTQTVNGWDQARWQVTTRSDSLGTATTVIKNLTPIPQVVTATPPAPVPGLTIPAEATAGGFFTLVNGTLTAVQKSAPASVYYSAIGATQTSGTTFSTEVTTDANPALEYFYVGAQNTGTGIAARSLVAWANGTSLYARYLNADGSDGMTVLPRTIKANTTYVIEVVTSNFGAVLYVYEKGQTRVDGVSYVQSATGWDQARWKITTRGGPWATTPSTILFKNLSPGAQGVTTTDTPPITTTVTTTTSTTTTPSVLTLPAAAVSGGYFTQTGSTLTVAVKNANSRDFYTGTGDSQPAGTTFSADVSFDDTRSCYFQIGAKNATTGTAARSMTAFFLDNQLLVRYVNADGTVGQTSLMSGIKANTPYAVEIVTSSTGATLYVYEKCKTRASGASFDQNISGWGSASWQVMTEGTPWMYSYAPPKMTINNMVTVQQTVTATNVVPVPGLSIPAAATSDGYFTQAGDTLTVATKYNATPVDYIATGDSQPLGTTFSAEVTLDNATSNSFKIGVQNTGFGAAPRNMLAFFNGSSLVARYLNADGTVGMTWLATLKANTTYSVEVVTSTSGATLYVYEKGQTRATGFLYTQAITGWDQAGWQIATSGDSAMVPSTMTVKNLTPAPQIVAVPTPSTTIPGGTPGLSVAAEAISGGYFAQSGDALSVAAKYSATPVEYTAIGNKLQPGFTFSAEVTLDSATANSFKIGVQNAGTGTAARSMLAYFNGSSLVARYLNTDGTVGMTWLATLKANTSYITEITTTVAGATLYVYEKGQNRATGVSYSQSIGSWDQVGWQITTNGASTIAPSTMKVRNLTPLPQVVGTGTGTIALTVPIAIGTTVSTTTTIIPPVAPTPVPGVPSDLLIAPAAVSAGYFTLVNGVLSVASKNAATAIDYSATGTLLTLGTTFKAEVITDTTATRNLQLGAQNSGVGIAARSMLASFSGNALYASYINADGTVSATLLTGSVKANTAYVIEVVTSTSDATLYVYEKGKTRVDGFTFTQTIAGWDQARWQIATHGSPSVTTPSTLLVSNMHTSTQVWKQDFTNPNVELLQDTNAVSTGAFVQSGGALISTQKNNAATLYSSATGASVGVPVNLRGEIGFVAADAQRDLTFGLSNNGSGSTLRRHAAELSGSSWLVSAWDPIKGIAISRILGAAAAGVTYVVEVEVDVQGSTLYVYPKGQERSNGYSDRQTFADWGSAKLTLTNRNSPSIGANVLTTVDNLQIDNLPSEQTLTEWALRQNLTHTQRVDTAYDFRGQVKTVSRYAKTDGTGAGLRDGSQSDTFFVYNQAGQLLQSVDPRGAATTAVANDYLTSYAYDGLGRLLSTIKTNAAGTTLTLSSTSYNDALRQSKVTLANGLITTTTYDQGGAAIAVVQTDGTQATPPEVAHTDTVFDKLGRSVAMRVTTTSGSLLSSYAIYDAIGRKVADIDAVGAVTEYVYNKHSQVTAAIRYANLATAGLLAGDPAAFTLAALRPSSAPAGDRVTRNVYDATGRLAKTIDAEGAVISYQYDGVNRLVGSTAYATRLTSSQLAALAGIAGEIDPADANAIAATDALNDRSTRQFYSDDGLLLGTLDAQGYLTENRYDSAGRRVQNVRYFNATNINLRTSASSVAALRPATDAQDVTVTMIYDGEGKLAGTINGENYLTEKQFDTAGNVMQTIAYANKVSASVLLGKSVAALRPTTTVSDQKDLYQYDAYNRLTVSESQPDGLPVTYQYDSVGNLFNTTRLPGALQQQSLTRYDVLGRVTAELSPENAARITAGMTQAQIDAVWSGYAVKYTYDKSGLRASATDALGRKTLFFYDNDGKVSYQINNAGEVTRAVYNAFGNATESWRYKARLTAAQLVTLTGGPETAALNTALSAVAGLGIVKTRADYTLRGQIRAAYDALNDDTQYTYNAFGERIQESILTSRTTGARLVNNMTFDRRGLATVAQGDVNGVNATTVNQYDAFGRLTQGFDADGNASAYSYDRAGRTIHSVVGQSAKDFSYDAFGRTLSIKTSDGTTVISYDDATRKTTIITPEGIATSRINNPLGQVIYVIDGAGNTTTYQYNKDGQIATVIDAAGSATSIYDVTGQLIKSTDKSGVPVLYTYDAESRALSRVVDPTSLNPSGLNLTTTTRYDALGRAVWLQDAKGVWTRTDYDDDGRVTMVEVDPVISPNWISGPNDNPNGLAIKTAYVYDAVGHVVSVTEGVGTFAAKTTSYAYDALGRRIQEVVDPQGLALSTFYAYDDAGNVVKRTDAAGNASYYGVDSFGRQSVKIDGSGSLTRTLYDAENRVIEVRQYTDKISAAVLAQLPAAGGNGVMTEGQLLALLSHPSSYLGTYAVYNKDGQLKYNIDAAGGVTRTDYDAAGNVSIQTRYANAVTVTAGTVGTTSSALSVLQIDVSRDRKTSYLHDAANRLTWQVDTLGGVTHFEYDANGNVVRRTVYATPNTGVITAAALLGAYAVTGVNDRVERAAFDTAGRRIAMIDAIGYVTRTQYDALGHAISTTAYSTKLGNPENLPLVMKWSDISPLQSLNAVSDRIQNRVFDAAGRMRYSVEALGYVTANAYDSVGRITSTTRYAKAIPLSTAMTTAGVGAALALVASTSDQTNSFFYDGAGRLRASTDAMAMTESYTYDGVGNKTSFTNKKGDVWTYEYDGAGRLTLETSPQVAVTEGVRPTADINGNWIYSQSKQEAIKTRMTYDALGNLIARTEAAGHLDATGQLAERTTQYRYDALGRQVKTIFPPVAIYDVAGDDVSTNGVSGDAQRKEFVPIEISSAVTYDALGNAVINRDVEGNLSYKVYDQAGRVRYEVDAASYVTGYERDAFGGVTKLTRYAYACPIVKSATVAVKGVQIADMTATLAVCDHTSDRSIQTRYDRLGQAVKVIEPQAYLYDQNTLYGKYMTGAKTTDTTYDGFGQVTKTSVYAGDAKGRALTQSADAYFYYNAVGQKSAQVMIAAAPVSGATPSGYVTTYAYDASGNLIRQVEFNDPLSVNASDAYYFSIVPAGKDRVVEYQYDRNNRKTLDKKIGVEYTDAVADAGSLPAIAATSGTVSTQYRYDAVGNLTGTTDALGQAAYTYYDALGRVTGSASAAPTPTLVSSTEFKLDAYGKVVQRIDYATAFAATETARPQTTSDGKDRITSTVYDADGRAVETMNAEHKVSFASYDAFGRVAKQWQTVTDYDQIKRTSFTVMRYDAVGRLVLQVTPGDANTPGIGLTRQKNAYNAFGEVTTRSSGQISAAVYAQEQAAANNPILYLTGGRTYGATGTALNNVTLNWSSEDPVTVFIEYFDQGGVLNGQRYDSPSGTNTYPGLTAVSGVPFTTYFPIATLLRVRVFKLIPVSDNDLLPYLMNWVPNWLMYDATPLANGQIVPTAMVGSTPIPAASDIGNGIQATEYFDYDSAGRLWRTNAGDGVDKVMLHDVQGNTTSTITRSDASKPSLKTYADVATVVALDPKPITYLTGGLTHGAFETATTSEVTLNWVSDEAVTVFIEYFDQGGVLNGQRYDSPSASNNIPGLTAVSGMPLKTYFSISKLLRVRVFKLIPVPDNDLQPYLMNWVPNWLMYDGTPLANGQLPPTAVIGGMPPGSGDILRTNYRYDLLGRLLEQTLPAHIDIDAPTRLEEGTVTQATILETTVLADNDHYTIYNGSNRVHLDWMPLGTLTNGDTILGSGDVKVETTCSLQLGGQTSYSQIFEGAQAETGADLAWSGSSVAPIVSVTHIKVSKKDGSGQWVVLIDSAPGVKSHSQLRINSPADKNTVVTMVYNLVGGASVSATLHDFGDTLAFDTGGLANGNYQYTVYYQLPGDTIAQRKVHDSGTFTLATTGSTSTSTIARGQKTAIKPVVTRTLDRWGNVLTINDARNSNWKTTYTYNANNQVTDALKPDAGGLHSESKFYYDKVGRAIATRDANNNVNGQRYDAAGNLVEELHADGGDVRTTYDLFGDRTQVSTLLKLGGNSIVTAYAYDQLGHLTSATHAAVDVYFGDGSYDGLHQIAESYHYDELGRRTLVTNAVGETSATRYDLRGNVIGVTDGLGRTSTNIYDAWNRKVGQTDGLGRSMTWQFDGFGRLLSHTDLSGARTTYLYNASNQLTSQSATGHGQNLLFHYDNAGLLKQIEDTATGEVTDYVYDLAGNRLRERTSAVDPVNGLRTVAQDNHLAYDTQGRLTSVDDGRYHVHYDYEANGNRTHITTSYLNDADIAKNKETWNRYDAMNRATVVDGADSSGAINAVQGHQIGYDLAGNRTSDTYYGKRISTGTSLSTTESYDYDADGRLANTLRDGIAIDVRRYDGANRALRTGIVLGSFANQTSITDYLRDIGVAAETRTYRYDAAGQMAEQIVYNITSEATSGTYYHYDNAGRLADYRIHVPRWNVTYDDTYTYTYDPARAFDSDKATSIGLHTTNRGDATTTNQYDQNGNLIGFSDTTGKSSKFINDAAGQILEKIDDKGHTHTLIANGAVIGSSDNTAQDSINTSYAPVISGAAGPSGYTVKANDTLQGIAKAVWGDATLWYVIAEANGLDASQPLTEGQVINLPAKPSAVYNDSNTFKPYNSADAIGDAGLNLPMPGNDSGCGGMGSIIVIIVAIVATVLTAGIASMGFAAAMDAGLDGIVAAGTEALAGGSISAAMVGGAVGSIASQGAAMAMGMQDKFSWRGVALGALGAGVSAGVASEFAASGGAISGPGSAAMAGRAAIASALTQGIGVATGLQDHFSWSAVAASAAGAGMGSVVAQGLTNTAFGNAIGKFGVGVLSGFAGGATAAALRGGRFSVEQVMRDNFGNALGSSLADQISGPSQQEQVLGATFADDMAARRAGNYWNPQSGPRPVAEFDPSSIPTFPDAPPMTEGGLAYLEDSVAGPGGGVGNLRSLDNRALLNAAEKRMNPGYYATPSSIQAAPGYLTALQNIYSSDLPAGQKLGMAWDNTKFYFRGSQAAQGTVQAVGGALEVAGAVGLSSTGVGATVGVPLAFHGGDNIGTGLSRIFRDESQNTVTYTGVEGLTGSPRIASFMDNAIPFAGGVAGIGQGMNVFTSSWKNAAYDPARGAAYTLYESASNAELSISDHIVSFAEQNGAKIEGFDYRLKSVDSLARKLGNSSSEINDTVRYTMTFEPENLGSGAQRVLSSFEDAGYEKFSVSNTFKQGRPYLGINTTLISPEGQMFELQFHTPESFFVKQNVNHGLYEQWRILNDGDPLRTTLINQMKANSSQIQIPPGIQKSVPSFSGSR